MKKLLLSLGLSFALAVLLPAPARACNYGTGFGAFGLGASTFGAGGFGLGAATFGGGGGFGGGFGRTTVFAPRVFVFNRGGGGFGGGAAFGAAGFGRASTFAAPRIRGQVRFRGRVRFGR